MSYGGKSNLGIAVTSFQVDTKNPVNREVSYSIESFNRSGTSYNSPFHRTRRTNRAVYRLKKETFKKSILVRIANPVYPLKSKIKYKYYRQMVKRTRMVKVPVPVKNSPAIGRLAVNNLSYWKTKTQTYGTPAVTITPVPGGSHPPTWRRVISGHTGILASFPPSGWGAGSSSLYLPSQFPAANLISINSKIINRLRDSAIRKIYAKTKDQNVNLQNFLAELGQTKGSLLQVVQRLTKSILLLRKGRLTQAARYLLPGSSKDLANDILLYKFGIAPLLSDIDGAMKHLAQNAVDQVCTVKSVSREVVSQRLSGVIPSSILSKREDLTIDTEFTVKCVLAYRVDFPKVKQLSQLGFTNPGSTAWELMPWSFVIDWLLPIGDYIDSLDAMSAITPVSFHTTVTVKQTVNCHSTYGGVVGSAPYRVKTSPGDAYWTVKNVCVARQTSLVPVMPTPVFTNPFSLSHGISAAALLVQLKR